MKFCDISSFYSESGGGVRTYHEKKIEFFKRHREHDYMMIVPSGSCRVRKQGPSKVYEVRGFPLTNDAAYRQLYDIFTIKSILARERPDVIEIGSVYLDNWLTLLCQIGSDAVKTGLYHADFPDSYIAPAVKELPRPMAKWFVGLWKRYVRLAYSRLDTTIVTSRYIERKLRSFGVTNTFRIPLGIDTAQFDPGRRSEAVRRSFGVGPGERILLYVGRFGSEKGIETLDAAASALLERTGCHLVLVGDGPLRRPIVDRLGARPRLHWLGFVTDRDRLADLYASSDIFLAPGPYETFGLTALEAMSSGLPIVGASTGGVAELVERTSGGVLFEAGSSGSLVDSVERLLGSRHRDVGRRARRTVVRRYSWESTFEKMIERYGRLVERKRSLPHETTLGASA